MSYVNITVVRSHRVMSLEKTAIFHLCIIFKKKNSIFYFEINTHVRAILKCLGYVFIKKITLFVSLMRSDVSTVIFAYKTKLNILRRKKVTKVI